MHVHYLLYSGCRHQGRCTNKQSVTRVLHVTNLGSSFENFLEINSSKTLLCTCMFVKVMDQKGPSRQNRRGWPLKKPAHHRPTLQISAASPGPHINEPILVRTTQLILAMSKFSPDRQQAVRTAIRPTTGLFLPSASATGLAASFCCYR